jgi:L-asparaginase
LLFNNVKTRIFLKPIKERGKDTMDSIPHFTLITAGGTIDKVYGRGRGVRDWHIGNPVAPGILRRMLNINSFTHSIACRRDSLDMNEANRRAICRRVQSSGPDHILITHGTDTMVETAQMLKQSLGVSWKRVVLVGSSQPVFGKDSDAEFRLGYALCAMMMSYEPGVIIAMDDIHSDPDKVTKGEDGIFRSFS